MSDISHIIKQDLQNLKNETKSKQLQRFFKTKKGEYGEGDIFIGISVPDQRKIAKSHYKGCNEKTISELLISEIHEYRLTALFILILKFQRSKTNTEKEKWVKLYLEHTKYVNNWDLVDSSAHHILGAWLHNKDKNILYTLAKSGHLWEERISMIACMFDIKKGEFETAFKIADILLQHKHDLIHKAVGWMLKEIGKIDIEAEEKYLNENALKMSRTTLRYSIEKFPETKRKHYLMLGK